MQIRLGKKLERAFALLLLIPWVPVPQLVLSHQNPPALCCCLLVPLSFSNHTALNTDPEKKVKVIPIVLRVAFVKKQINNAVISPKKENFSMKASC